RYAAYLDYVERIEGGESIESIGYGASNPTMVDEILADDQRDGAALLSRDLVGDYGDVSAFGQDIRRRIYPFYSWLEVNTRRYIRLIDNAYSQGIGSGLAATGIVGASIGARTTAYLGLRMLVVYGLVQAWNNLFHGDDEDKLSDSDRVRLHINLGKDDDGQIRTLRFQGALSDFLQWFGAEDAVSSLMAIEKGRADWGDVAKAVAKGPINRVASGITPVIKLPFELASGLQFWPDAFNPRAIRDRKRHTARLFGVEHEYDWLADKPSRGYLQSLESALVYKQDAGELAYNKIRGLAFDYNRRLKGTSGVSSFSSARSQATYEWRQAKRFGDKDAEEKARQEMRDLGMKQKDILSTKRRAHPLGGIARKDRKEFRATLSPREMESLETGYKWYRETYFSD
ncbi:hypothetical protein LCGC14_1668870, partial [marine sediment metagenome]